ncbi:Uncharacterized protein TCM_024322 [Theobroma cacao]|uniref:RRM domain-containing protein n=1 Tax=Theobroma cacao TaxID=3641 RepID=A0A061EV56_THECC|nr:Uncharacterized protein TCM_024322 [Theobroma cacao]
MMATLGSMRQTTGAISSGRQQQRFNDDSNGLHIQQWKSRLFSVYVGNLNLAITWRQLIRAFHDFGMVNDAFIWKPCQMLKNNKRPTSAFVRHRLAEEMRKAIMQGNGMMLVGRWIIVNKAIFMKFEAQSKTANFAEKGQCKENLQRGPAL